MTSLYVNIGGSRKTISSMYANISGGNKQIFPYLSITTLGDLSVGTSVYTNINGNISEFIIVHQGLPSNIYDSSCNGTWLLMKHCYTITNFGDDSSYYHSYIHSYLNSTFLNLFDIGIKEIIKQVKIPYTSGTGYNGYLQTGTSGLTTKIFILSLCELIGGEENRNYNMEGSYLKYFSINDDSYLLASNGYGNKVAWWTRTPNTYNIVDLNSVFYVDTTKGYFGDSYLHEADEVSNNYWIRPAFIINSTHAVDENYNIMA